MDIHSQLQTIDFVVIAVYAVSVIALGMGVSYRRRASDDLFLAGRSFGWSSGNSGSTAWSNSTSKGSIPRWT